MQNKRINRDKKEKITLKGNSDDLPMKESLHLRVGELDKMCLSLTKENLKKETKKKAITNKKANKVFSSI